MCRILAARRVRYCGFEMRIWLALAVSLALLAGCQKQDYKVLVGATAIVAPGAQPIDDSIILISGGKVRAVGLRKDIPVPQNSDRTDLNGEWVVPAEGTTIAVGQAANLMILHRAPTSAGAPGEASDIGARIVNGEWQTVK
jgi:hypothetical protein